MRKKLSELDRAEALWRMPEYQKDLKRLFQFREKLTKQEKAFEIKHAIRSGRAEAETIVYPKPLGDKLRRLEATNLRKYQSRERVILGKYGLVTLVTSGLTENLKRGRISRIALSVKKTRIVKIKVDLNLPEKESIFLAKKDIQALYQAFEKFREKPIGRSRGLTENPWEIYDMRHKRGLTLSQIAKERSGIDDYPSNNAKVMAAYQAAKRASERAERIIKQISEEIKK